jgi:hypothetical protein
MVRMIRDESKGLKALACIQGMLRTYSLVVVEAEESVPLLGS